jgi:hypothetical protein
MTTFARSCPSKRRVAPGRAGRLRRQTALRFASMEISPGRKRFLWVLLGLVVLNAVIFIWDRLRPSREDTS